MQMANVSASDGTPPTITTHLSVQCGQHNATLQFMVDTGAGISTIHQRTVQQFFANCVTHTAAATVRNYDGSTLKYLCGILPTVVQYKDKRTTATPSSVPPSYRGS